MRTFVRHALLWAVAVVFQAGFALADDYELVSSENKAASAGGDQKAAAPAPPSGGVERSTCAEQCAPDAGCDDCLHGATQRSCRTWYVDYRVRPMFDSHTSYEFGTAPGDVPAYAPLSKLDFALDSVWHGLQIGVEKPNWRAHFEWLTPIQRNISGEMADFDWNIFPPRNDPNRLDSLTLSAERWNDGQMLELGGEFKLTNCVFDLPIEIWPAAGFRFQRFNITAYNLNYIVPPLGPLRQFDGVDVISFNQQYYVGYFGGQSRTVLNRCGRMPIDLRLQVDGGPAAGFNVDHHLLREGDRFTMENTRGSMWHLALIAEAPITRRLYVGVQADHTEIRTTGTHRLVNVPLNEDLTWDNGVKVKSDQTSLTAFLRARF